MPCSGGYNAPTVADYAQSAANDALRLARENANAANKLTKMLCEVIKTLPAEQFLLLSVEVKAWYAKHQEFDKSQGR